MYKNLDEVFKYLDRINNIEDMQYLDCKWHSYDNIEWYKEILKEVLKDKPKRVVDIGSNLNQYGFLFENEDIEYIGIDILKQFNPLITDKIKFLHSDYLKVRDEYKDDVIISCLCVGYQVPIEEVKFKKLIVNSLDKNGNVSAIEFIRTSDKYDLPEGVNK